MQYLRGWHALRQDPEWTSKVGIATLIAFTACVVPVVGQLVLFGWHALMLRRAVSGHETPLPRLDFDTDYLMKLLGAGFKTFLARMLWSMPMMVVVFGSCCCVYLGFFGSAMSAAAGAESGSDAGAALGGLGSICLMAGVIVFYFVSVIAVSMPMQVAILRAELSDDLNAAMRFGEVMQMTKLLLKELLVGNLVLMGLLMAAYVFGIVTLYIGLIPAMVVVGVIGTYWQAELYRVYLEKGGEPLPVGPLDVEMPQSYRQPGQLPPQL